MDVPPLGISNTVDSTGAFVVATVATTDVSTCSGLGVWYVRGLLRNLAIEMFDISVLILDTCLTVYLPIHKLKFHCSTVHFISQSLTCTNLCTCFKIY